MSRCVPQSIIDTFSRQNGCIRPQDSHQDRRICSPRSGQPSAATVAFAPTFTCAAALLKLSTVARSAQSERLNVDPTINPRPWSILHYQIPHCLSQVPYQSVVKKPSNSPLWFRPRQSYDWCVSLARKVPVELAVLTTYASCSVLT